MQTDKPKDSPRERRRLAMKRRELERRRNLEPRALQRDEGGPAAVDVPRRRRPRGVRLPVLATLLVAPLLASITAAESQPPPPHPIRSTSGVLQPGDTLHLQTNPGGRGVGFVVLAGGQLACRAAVPDKPAREWARYLAGTPLASVAAELGPDGAKAAGEWAWRLIRCQSPPPADRSCASVALVDHTGEEIRRWAHRVAAGLPGVAYLLGALATVSDDLIEQQFDRARDFSRGCGEFAPADGEAPGAGSALCEVCAEAGCSNAACQGCPCAAEESGESSCLLCEETGLSPEEMDAWVAAVARSAAALRDGTDPAGAVDALSRIWQP